MITVEQNLKNLGVTFSTSGTADPVLSKKLHEGICKLLVEVGLEAFELRSLKLAPQAGSSTQTQNIKPLDLCFCCTGDITDFDCRWDPDCNCNN